MAELSPAAQAVFEAAWTAYWLKDAEHPADAELIAAAALRAAANQLLAVQWEGQMPADITHQIGINWARDALHVLANELEAL